MTAIPKALAAMAITLVCTGLEAGDYGLVMDVAKATWPDKNHLAVVANYRHSKAEIEALALDAGAGQVITVLDVGSASQVSRAAAILANNVKPDYVLLLPNDSLVFDSSFATTQVIRDAARKGIPTVATTSVAIQQGAVFAIGAGTGMELMITPRTIGTVDVILPAKGSYLRSTAQLVFPQGKAEIRVHAAR